MKKIKFNNTQFKFLTGSIFFLVFLSSCDDKGVNPFPEHSLDYKGFSYTSFEVNGFTKGNTINALEDLQTQTASRWVGLCIFEFQRTPNDTIILPNSDGKNPLTGNAWYSTSSREDIIAAVVRARQLGLKIMLKPHIDTYSGQWRGAILPDSNGKWFASYRTMLMKYVLLAESLHVELFCVGTELLRATQVQFTTQWKQLIAEIRTRYSGKLTYSANWSGAFEIQQPEFQQIQFWDALDYIGTSAYVPLTEKNSTIIPTYNTAMKKIAEWKSILYSTSIKFGKKVLLTEIGCQSATGALSAPYDFYIGSAVSVSADNTAQEFFYNCMIESFRTETFCAGMFWWNWESVYTANESKNYTCRNKPAAIVVRNFYQQ